MFRSYLQGEFSVGLLDFVFRGILLEPQDLVELIGVHVRWRAATSYPGITTVHPSKIFERGASKKHLGAAYVLAFSSLKWQPES